MRSGSASLLQASRSLNSTAFSQPPSLSALALPWEAGNQVRMPLESHRHLQARLCSARPPAATADALPRRPSFSSCSARARSASGRCKTSMNQTKYRTCKECLQSEPATFRALPPLHRCARWQLVSGTTDLQSFPACIIHPCPAGPALLLGQEQGGPAGAAAGRG